MPSSIHQKSKLNKVYEVLFFSGWGEMPAYYLVTSAEGTTPIEALKESLPEVIAEIRRLFCLDDDIADEEIQKSIYLLKDDGLVSVADLERQRC